MLPEMSESWQPTLDTLALREVLRSPSGSGGGGRPFPSCSGRSSAWPIPACTFISSIRSSKESSRASSLRATARRTDRVTSWKPRGRPRPRDRLREALALRAGGYPPSRPARFRRRAVARLQGRGAPRPLRRQPRARDADAPRPPLSRGGPRKSSRRRFGEARAPRRTTSPPSGLNPGRGRQPRPRRRTKAPDPRPQGIAALVEASRTSGRPSGRARKRRAAPARVRGPGPARTETVRRGRAHMAARLAASTPRSRPTAPDPLALQGRPEAARAGWARLPLAGVISP